MYSASRVIRFERQPIVRALSLATVVPAAMICCVLAPAVKAQNAAPPESMVSGHRTRPEIFLFPEPPANVDATKFSDVELAHYGLPPRPDSEGSPELYARWHHMLATQQTRIVNPRLEMTNVAAGPARNLHVAVQASAELEASGLEPASAAGGAVSAKSDNWSGYALGAKKGTFNLNNTTVSAEYYVPKAQDAFGTCSDDWDYAFQWVGIDGYTSADVLQAGTEADVTCSGGNSSTFYSAWYEWFPFLETRISGLPIAPGDFMGIQVWYTTAAPHGHAYILNYTNKQSVTVAFNPPSGTSLVGDSVEWIVERPTVAGSLVDLTNYVADGFNFAYAYQGKKYFYPGAPPSGTKAYNITMYCSPWSPGAACETNEPISYANLYGKYALWFYDEKAAY
jgi:hypothetical protein